MTPLQLLNASLDEPIEADCLQSMIRSAIEAVTNVPSDDLQASTPLEALGLDSLAVTEVLLELEDRIGTELPADVLAALDSEEMPETLGDVYRLLIG